MWKYTGVNECNEFLLSLDLLNCKDKRKYIKILYTLANSQEKNYREFKIKKRSGAWRTIYEPSKILKFVQRNILNNVLLERPISMYAKAYYPGLSLNDNAMMHVNKKMILKLDIKDFFDNISFMSIYKACFPIEYYPFSVGMLLTNLCTLNDHLVQGAPTSAYISNLVMRDFDENVGRFAEKFDISYTRYSDDMTFSGEFEPSIIIRKVRQELCKLGLRLNDKKTVVIKNSTCQKVTGIVVNKKMQVSLKYRKKIRQEIYYIKKFGLNEHLNRLNIKDSEKYLNSLLGRILFVVQVDPNNQEFRNYKDIVIKVKS